MTARRVLFSILIVVCLALPSAAQMMPTVAPEQVGKAAARVAMA